MTFDQIKYFMAVVEHGSFSKAAEYLFISQSSLSKQIKSLEDELKNRLFLRNGARVELTTVGRSFLEFSKNTIDAYRDFLNQACQSGTHCTLRVGTLPLLLEYGFMDLISHHQLQYAHVQLALNEDTQVELLKMLDDQRLDAVIARSDFLSPDKYRIVPSHEDVLCIVCSLKHRLARKEEVSLRDIADEALTVLGRDSSLYRLTYEACLKSGFTPNIVFTSNRHAHLLSMLREDPGMVSILPRKMIEQTLGAGVAIIDLKEKIRTVTSLVLDKRSTENPYINEFSDWWRAKIQMSHADEKAEETV